MSVRWLGVTEPMPRILLYYFLLSTVMAIPIAAIQWHSVPARAWIYLLGIGFAQLFAQVLIVLAYRYASSVKLGPFILDDRLHGIDQLGGVASSADAVRRRGMVLVIGGGLVAIRGKSEAPLASIES
jgi:drug/metabolite transporter (DMT)-like permease